MVVSRPCAGRADRGKRLSKKRPRRMAEPRITSLLPSALAAGAAVGGAMHRHPSAGNDRQNNKRRQQQAGVQNDNHAVHRSAGGSGADALGVSGGIHGHFPCHHSRFAPFLDVDRSIAQNALRCKRKNYYRDKNQPNQQFFPSPSGQALSRTAKFPLLVRRLPKGRGTAYAVPRPPALAGLIECDTPSAAFRCRCPRSCSAPSSARSSR